MNLNEVIIGDMTIKGNVIYKDEIFASSSLLDCIDRMYSFVRNEVEITNDTVIAIALQRGIDYIIADLMALKYGITFLNIDLSLPKERILYMLEDANVDAVVCKTQYDLECAKAKKVIIDDYLAQIEKYNCEASYKNEIAYILYTSGTTGKPKGVEVRREALYWFIKDVPKYVDFSKSSTIACFTNQTFDIYFLEVYLGLLIGLDLVLGGNEDINNPKRMINLISKHNVDTLQLTPSKYRMLQTIDKESKFLKNIKVLMIGGEQFSGPLLEDINRHYNGAVYNMYGPTETTIWSTIAELTSKDKVTIGKPLENTFVYILDENKRILSNGEQGEIAIGGKGLAKGYKNREDLTNEKFVILDNGQKVYLTGDLGKYNADGELECLGRKDSQVKVNGHRIELDEIDSLLSNQEGVKIALTCFSSEDNKMFTFYCANEEIDNSKFVEYLNKYVPEYMVPSRFVKVDEVKYTPSGKSDRKAMLNEYLREGNSSSITNNDEVDDIQKEILELIIEIGELSSEIGLNTPFIEIGLDSIEFINIVVEVETIYDIEFDDDNMLIDKYSSVDDFVNYIKSKIEEN